MSSTYARAAAGLTVQRARTVAGERERGRLDAMQREMDAIACGIKPCDFAYAVVGRHVPARPKRMAA